MNPSRVELESKISFLERTIDDLNEVLLAQGAAIDELSRRLESLESRKDAGQELEGESADPLDQVPPHY